MEGCDGRCTEEGVCQLVEGEYRYMEEGVCEMEGGVGAWRKEYVRWREG